MDARARLGWIRLYERKRRLTPTLLAGPHRVVRPEFAVSGHIWACLWQLSHWKRSIHPVAAALRGDG